MTDLMLWLEGMVIALDIKQAEQVAKGHALYWVDLPWSYLWRWVARARHAGWR